MTPPAPAPCPSILIHDTSQNRRTLHPASASASASASPTDPARDAAPPRHHRHPLHSRRHSQGPEWRTAWDPRDWLNGRVLLIDYVGSETSDTGKRKIVAQEFHRVEELRGYCANKQLRDSSLLRVIHVQNSTWAMRYLLRKYNMEHQDDLIGSEFGRWAKFERPQQRAGKPVLNGRTFRPQRDPWRGISRCAFGFDYLRHYDAHKYNTCSDDESVKMMELNWYDAAENPKYGCDVFVQRLSVYVQKHEGPPIDTDEFDMRDPYNEEEYQEYMRLQRRIKTGREARRRRNHGYFPRPDDLDNSNTIIIFEQAQSRSPEDTLIQARNEIESRWRRLPFFVKKEQRVTDQQLAVECMDLVLKDVFKSLAMSWENFLRACETHVSILEDKIYDNPADESRAPELWMNSSQWLKVEKLIYLHLDIAKEARIMMKELTADEGVDEWLSSVPEDFDKLANSVQEDLIKPTGNLNDMMYKSVEIRDARQGLRMDASMWRLSWITFIFLPGTFMVSFFGMNVDTFENNPSIKWYFVSLVPLFVIIALLMFAFKHISSLGDKSGPSAVQRGAYEHLFREFSDLYPRLWSPNGPRQDINPRGGFFHGIKWRLVKVWYKADRTIRAEAYNPAQDLGEMGRLKRRLTQSWLKELNSAPLSLDIPPLDSTSGAQTGMPDLDIDQQQSGGSNRNSTHSNGSSGFHTGHTTALSNGNISARANPRNGTVGAPNLSVSNKNATCQTRTSLSPPQPTHSRNKSRPLNMSRLNDFPSPVPDLESGLAYGDDNENYPFPFPTRHRPFCTAPNPFTPAFGPLTALLGPGPAHEVRNAGVASMGVVGSAVASPVITTAAIEEQSSAGGGRRRIRSRSRSRSTNQRGRLRPVQEAAWRGAVVGAVPAVGLGHAGRHDNAAAAPDAESMIEEMEADKEDDAPDAVADADRPRPLPCPRYWPAAPPPSPTGPIARAATSPTISALRHVMVVEEDSSTESGSDVDRSRSPPPTPSPRRPRPRTSSLARLSVPGIDDVDGLQEEEEEEEEEEDEGKKSRSMQTDGGW